MKIVTFQLVTRRSLSVDNTLTAPTLLLTNEEAASPSQPITDEFSRALTNVRLLTARTDGATTGVMSEAAISLHRHL